MVEYFRCGVDFISVLFELLDEGPVCLLLTPFNPDDLLFGASTNNVPQSLFLRLECPSSVGCTYCMVGGEVTPGVIEMGFKHPLIYFVCEVLKKRCERPASRLRAREGGVASFALFFGNLLELEAD